MKLPTRWTDRFPKWFWKLPFVWRFKYNFYHEQFIEPVKPTVHKKDLSHIKYEAVENGDIVYNPYAGARFRCPNCGQAHELKFTYQAEDLRIKQDEALETVWLERVRNGVAERYNETDATFFYYTSKLADMVQIPCHECHETYPKWMWSDAYKRPLVYFETENVCHCGGEMYFEPDVLGNHYLTCEKCKWVKPNSKVSGAEGDDN